MASENRLPRRQRKTHPLPKGKESRRNACVLGLEHAEPAEMIAPRSPTRRTRDSHGRLDAEFNLRFLGRSLAVVSPAWSELVYGLQQMVQRGVEFGQDRFDGLRIHHPQNCQISPI